MRKNKLIEMLQEIPGNPEVMLWNGFVQDVVPIDKSIELVELVRDEKEYFCWLMEREGATEADIKMFLRKREWTINDFMLSKADKKDIKKVYVLQARHTGKKQFDRVGTMEY